MHGIELLKIARRGTDHTTKKSILGQEEDQILLDEMVFVKFSVHDFPLPLFRYVWYVLHFLFFIFFFKTMDL